MGSIPPGSTGARTLGVPRCPTWDGRNGRADLRTTASWSRQTLSGHRVSLYALQMIYVTRWNTSWAPPGTGAGAAGRDPVWRRTSLPCDSPRLSAGFERKPWHSPPCFVVCQRRPGGPFQAVRPAFPEVCVCVCVCVCNLKRGRTKPDHQHAHDRAYTCENDRDNHVHSRT